MLRRIPLGNMRNLRDLGGYAAGNGTILWERVLRGDLPRGLTEADVDWLLDRDITTVIDLRGDEELEHRPDEFKFLPGFHYHHLPLMGEHIPQQEEDVGKGYFYMVDEGKRMAAVLRMIAHAPGGVLFHCAAGKDRTGCVAAVLLSLAEVERSDILADYQVSETYIMDVIRRMAGRIPDMAAWMGRSKSEYMETCLDLLWEKYGSVEGYLQAVGITEEEMALLRGKLLE